jgi:predicted nuclease with TOPRIM domain
MVDIETQIEILKQQISNLSSQVTILKEENQELKKQLTNLTNKIEIADIGNCNYICGMLVKHEGTYWEPESVLTYDSKQKCLVFK